MPERGGEGRRWLFRRMRREKGVFFRLNQGVRVEMVCQDFRRDGGISDALGDKLNF